MNNCKTCKHFNGCAVVGSGDEPCYSCLKSKEKYLPSYEEAREKVTNADRIRAMSDEELADFLCSATSHNTVNCAYCIAEDYCEMGKNGFHTWLILEAKE